MFHLLCKELLIAGLICEIKSIDSFRSDILLVCKLYPHNGSAYLFGRSCYLNIFIFWNISLLKQSPLLSPAFYCTNEIFLEGYLIKNCHFILWRGCFHFWGVSNSLSKSCLPVTGISDYKDSMTILAYLKLIVIV